MDITSIDVARINLLTLAISSVVFYVLYLKSTRPAALEKEIGSRAYRKCAQYRSWSAVFMTIASINYIIYYFFPLDKDSFFIITDITDDTNNTTNAGVTATKTITRFLSLPQTFPWPYKYSIGLATCIALPCGYLLWRGMKDAGEETMVPKKEHSLYGGIYQYIRHPQGVGEMPLWWVLALACHSPFLMCWSCIYLPMWIHMCLAEENDLVLRYGAPYEAYRENVGAFIPKLSLLFEFSVETPATIDDDDNYNYASNVLPNKKKNQ